MDENWKWKAEIETGMRGLGGDNYVVVIMVPNSYLGLHLSLLSNTLGLEKFCT